MTSWTFAVTSRSHASEPRRTAMDRARELGFDDTRTGAVGLVVTELATNIVRHGQPGELIIRDTGGQNPAIEVLAIDKGGGMENIARAMEDGYSTAGTLGHGLGTVRRQSDRFEIFSQTPGGTVVLARIHQKAENVSSCFAFAGVSVAHAGEPVCGDDWDVRWRSTQGEVLVVDGLGHGVMASEAAMAAVRTFRASTMPSPALVIDELHAALRPTRGAAVAVAALDLDSEIVRYSGLGNIGASIVNAERRRVSLVSQNGTAGHSARRVHEYTYPFRGDSALVMFSDGLSSGWEPSSYPTLWSHDPAVIAGVLYRDFSRHRDDVTVVVGKRVHPDD